MNKLATTVLLFFILPFIGRATEEEIVKSTISEVTVYAQGAQIFRKASYTVKPGVTEVVIEGVSPNLDPKSLQVKATGNIIILDSKYSLYYPKPETVDLDGLPLKVRQDIRVLEDSIENMNFELREIQDEIDVLNATKSILANNGAIRGQGKVNDSIALLKQAMEYYTQKMMELNKKLLTLNRKKADKSERLNGMNARLQELRNYQSNNKLNERNQGPTHRVTITVSAKDATSGKLSISYLVSNAGWIPMYDLRSDITTGKINLNYKAQVYQNTGVDWEDVRLNISTNNPYQNKTRPELHPWYVDFNNYQQQNKYNQDATIQLNAAPPVQQAYTKDVKTAKSESLNEVALSSNQFVQVINHTISAEFRIDLPYTIKANNQQHMVLVKNEDLDAGYKYFTVPKLDNGVYLIAELTDLADLQLVPAKANIFFDGSYVGETYLDPGIMDDTLRLSLGRDPNIIVKRTLLKKDSKEKTVGSSIERTFAYSIQVKNQKATAIELIVLDQVPVTQNADIEIELLKSGRAHLDERTGTLKWTFSLKPNESQDIEFSYQVKHAKDMTLYL